MSPEDNPADLVPADKESYEAWEREHAVAAREQGGGEALAGWPQHIKDTIERAKAEVAAQPPYMRDLLRLSGESTSHVPRQPICPLCCGTAEPAPTVPTVAELVQLFQNKSDCYADGTTAVQAMTEDRFVEVVGELLARKERA